MIGEPHPDPLEPRTSNPSHTPAPLIPAFPPNQQNHDPQAYLLYCYKVRFFGKG
jgi:hypothetical protein